jgi:hypothetical protein
MQSLNRKDETSNKETGATDAMITLKLSVFTAQSRIIRSPMGILSLSNFKLYNSDTLLKDLNITGSSK